MKFLDHLWNKYHCRTEYFAYFSMGHQKKKVR